MKARDILGLLLLVALGAGVAVYAGRIVNHRGGSKLELGRTKLSQVSGATRERLATLEDPVLLTWFVSSREEMPSELKRLEARGTELLNSLREASDGQLDYQIVDPQKNPERVAYAANQGIAPFRVRSIQSDAWSEKTIWSTLTITYGARRQAVINGLVPKRLHDLQGLLVAELNQMESPRRPVVAIDAGERFSTLRALLAEAAEVLEIDFEEQAELPAQADLFLWLEPESLGADQLAALDLFLESGRAAVVAGGNTRMIQDYQDFRRFRVEPTGFDSAAFWRHFGCESIEGLVLDERCHQWQPAPDKAPIALPYLLRCIAPNQDFRRLAAMPNGTLLFEAPTPIEPRPELLSELGLAAQVLAHSSDATWIEALPSGFASAEDLAPKNGVPAPRLPLAVMLSPLDPWQGSLLGMGSAASLRDDAIGADGFAHRRLVDVIQKEFLNDDRLVLNRTERNQAPPLPQLSPTERLAWRATCVGLLPLLIAIAAWVRTRSRRRNAAELDSTSKARGRALAASGGVLLFALAAVASRATDTFGLQLDLTRAKRNQLAAFSVERAAAATGENRLRAELFFSKRSNLPPSLRGALQRIRGILAELDRAGADLEIVRLIPEELSSNRRLELEAEGLEPLRISAKQEGVTTVRTVYTSLRLSSGGNAEILRFSDADALDELEFRLAFALWRMQSGRTPHIAFASDTPRLSPAEAHMDFQLKGRFAPMGSDVYSAARSVLREAGFRVTHVNPRDPEFPSDIDLLVWLQPRRDITAMLDPTVRYLRGGGKLLLAAQHFNMQARQFRGRGFDTVYWPQPQTPDIDLEYFGPETGIQLVREVLFDELKTRMTLETQVNRDAENRDYEQQESALPFALRASAANFSQTSPITRGLGDQAFTWANYIDWDEDKLSQAGIEAEVLITSSDRAWSYAWTGGYLAPEVLRGPWATNSAEAAGESNQGGSADADSATAPPTPPAPIEGLQKRASVPLAVRFRGTFPPPSEPIAALAEGAEPNLRGVPEQPAAPGDLLLIGCSELFKNEALAERTFRSEHLLISSVAAMALPDGLAAVAARWPARPGLDYVSPQQRTLWKRIVWSSGPLLVLIFGGLWTLLRRGRPTSGRSNAA